MRRFPFKPCLLCFPTWSPGQMAGWPTPSRTKQVDCQKGKVRKPKLGTESTHVGRIQTRRLTCWWILKYSQAGKWWSPEGVGTEGSLTMSRAYTPDAGLLRWVELSTEHPERWCLSQHSLPAMAVFLYSHPLGTSSWPPWDTHFQTTLYWKLPWEDELYLLYFKFKQNVKSQNIWSDHRASYSHFTRLQRAQMVMAS